MAMPVEKAFRLLHDIPFFRDVPAADLKRLGADAFCRRVGKGRDVMVEGSRCGFVAILVDGYVKIVNYDERRTFILRIMGHGGLLGEIAALNDCPHTATVTTHQDCDLLCVPEESFSTCLQQSPPLMHNLVLIQQERECRFSQQALTRATCSAASQLTQQLVFLVEDFGAKNARGEIALPFPLTQQLLADLLGTCRESVNAAVRAFEQSKFLSVSHEHYFTLHDFQSLKTQHAQSQTTKRGENVKKRAASTCSALFVFNSCAYLRIICANCALGTGRLK